jgi:hypothetical protein
MNWGKGIITGMTVFMLFILGMCMRMFMVPADEYDHHYYEKGLNFDADYKHEQQVSADHATPAITQLDKSLAIKFIAPAKGVIKFIRPSSQLLDKTFNIQSNDVNEAIVPSVNIQPGKWQLILSWVSNGKEYLYQQDIYLK